MVVGNAEAGIDWPKTLRLRQLASELSATASLQDMFAVLGDRSQPPDHELPDTGVGIERERKLAPIFIIDAVYGTRCSSLVEWTDSGARAHERSFGSDGHLLGERSFDLDWPAP